MEILSISKIFLEKSLEDFTKVDAILLQKVIRIHDELYFNEQAPVIGDTEYDMLKKKLEKLEDEFGLEKVSETFGAEVKGSTFEKKNIQD